MTDDSADRILGIHSLTALTSDARRALDFYMRILRLRLAERSAYRDDGSAYHLVFGDGEHSPGMIAMLERKNERRGAWGIGGIHHVAFATETRDTLRQWKRWLTDSGVRVTGPYDRVYFESIYFPDPDGLIIEIATRGPGWTVDEAAAALGREVKLPPPETMAQGRDEVRIAADTWPDSIPAPTPDMRLERLHHITAIGSDAEAIERFYIGLLGMRLVKRTVNFDDPTSPHLYFGVGDGAPGTIVTYFVYPPGTVRPARPGTGLTHHFALGVRNEEALRAWREELNVRGTPASDIRDNDGYKSISVRDPDGLTLEIATAWEQQ